MATIGYERIKTLSVLNAGRVAPPQFDGWRFVGDRSPVVFDAEPSAVGDGISVSEAIKGWVGTRTSPDAATWRLWLKVHTADAGEVYGVNFFLGFTEAFEVAAAGADIATIVSNLQTAFDGSAPFAAEGGVATQPAGTTGIILLTFTNLSSHLKRLAPVQINAGTVTGIGFQSLIPEATRAVWQLWAQAKGTGEWLKTDKRGSSAGPQDLVKLCGEFAGVERHHLQVIDADGVVLPVYAPAINELDADTAEQAASQALVTLEAQLLTTLPNDYVGRLPMISHSAQAFETPTLIRGAATVKSDSQIVVQLTSTVLMQANPERRGFMVRASPANANNVHVRWDVTGADLAALTDMVLQPGEIYTAAGDDIPGNAMIAIADTAAGNVNVQDW